MSPPAADRRRPSSTPRQGARPLFPLLVLAAAIAALAPAAFGQAAATQPATSSDQKIERGVEARLDGRPALREVKADVDQGVATLSGQVPTPPDRKQAGELTADAPGVREVRNRIQLDPDLALRFSAALAEVKGKLVRLVANLPLLVVALLIVAFSVWLGGVLGRRLHIVKRFASRNPYMEGLLRSVVRGLVVLGGVLLALDLLDATSLVGAVLGSAGVVGLVLGFAFKDIAENYIAGVLLSIRRPFNPGDLVRIDSHEGRVIALTSRATQLMTLEGNHLQLPNALVFKSVMLNYSRNPRRRFDFSTNVAVGQSWHDAMEIGIRAIREIDGVLDNPAPSALIRELADGHATLQFFGWIDQTRNDLAKTRSEAMRNVRRTLREAGIVPPDGVQKISVLRHPARETIEAADSATSRDTSVDRTLDRQLVDAQGADDAVNLLDGKPAP